jgi:nitrogen fixation/metabolism regulation signal transduction histidine kinase
VDSYKQIARLPEPEKKHTSIAELVTKIIPLYQRNNVKVVMGEDVNLYIDPIQIEQVLINLIKNAVESVQGISCDGGVEVSWHVQEHLFSLFVIDDGAGISNPDNLFVPFYTTKQQGAGIGLVLCRQILEGHGGQLTLTNREESRGCLATIELHLS